MRRFFECWLLLTMSVGCCAQEERLGEISADVQEQRMLEERVDLSEDEDGVMHLDHLLRFRLPLNIVDPERLLELPGITRLQVRHFELYRSLLGPFIDILELQAIPGWDPETIRRIRPFVKLAERENPLPMLSERFRKGEHLMLFRSGGSFSGKGEVPADSTMSGGAMRTLLRYNYRFGQLMQWGVTMEKDPGEALWRRGSPDFISGHFSVRELGLIKALVAGDYQVSMGQGLIHWQGMSFGMGSDGLSILKQAPVLKPYNGTDENRFHRGAGLWLRRGGWDGFVFYSSKRVDANMAADSVSGRIVRSLLTSGLHRTVGEIEDKDALHVRTAGGGIRYGRAVWQIGWQGIVHDYRHPLVPEEEPYRMHAIRGDRWFNQSVSWGGTIRNLHAFGEAALDIKGRSAIVQGVLMSLHRDLDMGLLVRHIAPGYRAWQADAHTAQSEPMNETGAYVGVAFRPIPGVKLDGWFDVSQFHMWRYRLDAPSFRSAHLLNLQWQPDKRTRLLWRWQHVLAERNQTVTSSGVRSIKEVRRQTWRWHIEHALPSDWQIRLRADASWVTEGQTSWRGGLIFIDLLYRPPMGKFRWTGRFAWYEADEHEARLFAFEQDVPFQQSMSAFYGRGVRAYMVVQFKQGRHWQFSAKTGLGSQRGAGSPAIDFRLQVIHRAGAD